MKPLNDKANRELLIKTVMDIYKSRAEETTALRVLEKDLAQTSKALTNLWKAIESGIFTESRNKDWKNLNQQRKLYRKRYL